MGYILSTCVRKHSDIHSVTVKQNALIFRCNKLQDKGSKFVMDCADGHSTTKLESVTLTGNRLQIDKQHELTTPYRWKSMQNCLSSCKYQLVHSQAK